MLTTIIGITGRKFNGKDTCADYLIKNYGFIKMSFGDSLKKAAQEIFGFTDEQLWGTEKETIDKYWKITPREMLQYVGTDLMRINLGCKFPIIADNIWIKSVEKKIILAQNNGNNKIVIPDVRFPNEADFIHNNYNGCIINVIRDNMVSYDTYISENSINDISTDKVIHNTSILQLYADLDDYMKTLNIERISKNNFDKNNVDKNNSHDQEQFIDDFMFHSHI
jgi:hypothetical protein